MKLKEWGLMRHKPHNMAANRRKSKVDRRNAESEDAYGGRDSSATLERFSSEATPISPEGRGDGWRSMSENELSHTEPAFMDLLDQQPT